MLAKAQTYTYLIAHPFFPLLRRTKVILQIDTCLDSLMITPSQRCDIGFIFRGKTFEFSCLYQCYFVPLNLLHCDSKSHKKIGNIANLQGLRSNVELALLPVCKMDIVIPPIVVLIGPKQCTRIKEFGRIDIIGMQNRWLNQLCGLGLSVKDVVDCSLSFYLSLASLSPKKNHDLICYCNSAFYLSCNNCLDAYGYVC